MARINKNLKTTFISTVYNEEKNIRKFLESIISQTKKPDEIIIVDGGSTDRTIKIIEDMKNNTKIPFKLIIEQGANIAKGRNIAISKAKNKIIMASDAGCVVDKDWIKNTIKFFPKADVVAGNYKAITKNNFEFFQGILTVNKVDRPTRMSSRNISFKKDCWKKVKGYPEECLTGEDTKYNLKLIKQKCKVKINPFKGVSWEMRPTFRLFFKQFFKYGQGDKIQGNLIKLKKNLSMILGFWAFTTLFVIGLFFNPSYSLALLSLPIIYLLAKSFKIFLKTLKLSSFVYVPIFEFLKRMGYILGATFG